MSNQHTVVNSEKYWDTRFETDWCAQNGDKQSRFFARLALMMLPKWILDAVVDLKLSVLDWGCAEGDGTDELATCMHSELLTGMDFSLVAIESAKRKYPSLHFVQHNVINQTDVVAEHMLWDIVFSSNTLEHFDNPFNVLNVLSKHARKAVIALLPYKELNRIKEHFFTFTEENIPVKLDNGFILTWSSVCNCSKLKNKFWSGEQIVLVYASSDFVSQLDLMLENMVIQTCDINNILATLELSIEQSKQEYDILKNNYQQKLYELESIYTSKSWKLMRLLHSTVQMPNNLFSKKLLHCFLKKIYISLPASIQSHIEPLRIYYKEKYNSINKIQSDITTKTTLKSSIFEYSCIKNNSHKQLVVYGPTILFSDSLVQRPQHLSKALSDENCFVVYIELGELNAWREISPNFHILNTNDLERAYKNLKGSLVIFPQGVNYYNCFQLMHSIAKSNFFIFEYLDHIDAKICGSGARQISDTLQYCIENNKDFHFISTAKNLQLELQLKNPGCEILLNENAVDLGIFKKDEKLKIPTEIASIVAQQKPIIGYFGAIAPWLDYAEINKVMVMRSDCNFVFIGPDYAGGSKNLNTSLSNCHWIGKVENQNLARYAQHFTIAWIPFQSGDIAQGTSPLKFFEYCALGLGVVVNKDLIECTKFIEVKSAKNAEEYSKAFDELFVLCSDVTFIEKIFEIAHSNTWQQRAKAILEFADRNYMSCRCINKIQQKLIATNKCYKNPNSYYQDVYCNFELGYWYATLPWIVSLNNVKSILDIGGAYGTLLLFSSEMHNAKRRVLLDVFSPSTSEIDNVLGIERKSINIEKDDVTNLGQFDLILFTEVLEHLNFNPVSSLKKISTLLHDDGHLILTTPSSETWGRTLKYYKNFEEIPFYKNDSAEFVDGHIWQYSFEELQEVLKSSGFKILEYVHAEGFNGFKNHCLLLSK